MHLGSKLYFRYTESNIKKRPKQKKQNKRIAPWEGVAQRLVETESHRTASTKDRIMPSSCSLFHCLQSGHHFGMKTKNLNKQSEARYKKNFH
jgi:hypothetical protein